MKLSGGLLRWGIRGLSPAQATENRFAMTPFEGPRFHEISDGRCDQDHGDVLETASTWILRTVSCEPENVPAGSDGMIKTSKPALTIASAVLAAGLCSSATAAQITTLQTFPAPDGETYFALAAKSDQPARTVVGPRSHVVLMDTSASQVGAHRTHAIAVLDSFLKSLPESDRVTVFAVDVTAVQLTKTGVSPADAHRLALLALKSRLPAGSTDMLAGLRAAQEILNASKSAAITYLGDGMSTANLLQQQDLQSLLTALTRQQISVHTYAVGPNKDRQLLGILSHHTGGRAMSDVGADAADTVGRELAHASRLTVEYPTALPLDAPGAALVPSRPLPLRTDQETVYLGRGNVPQIRGDVVRNDRGNTFLYGFYRQSDRDGGLNPLAGLTALNDARQGFEDEIARLEKAGLQAVELGQFKQAESIGLKLKQVDPQNVRAEAIIGKAGTLRVSYLAQADQPAPQLDSAPAPTDNIPAAELLNQSTDLSAREQELDATLTLQAKQREKILTEKMATEIEAVITAAQQRMADNPDGVLADLEAARGSVKSSTDINPDVRAQLLRRVTDAIQDVRGRRETLTANQVYAQRKRSEQEAQQRLTDAMVLDELRLTQLVDRIRALMYEGFQGNAIAFEEAEAVARQIESMEPGSAIGAQLVTTTEAAGQLDKLFRLKSLRADKYLAQLYQVELSHVPFPDEPPVNYPPAPVWRALTERRKKWASVDLHRNSPNEQRIYDELDKETVVEFVDMPLADAIDYIAQLHNITILLDRPALLDEGLSDDEPINLILNGVKLQSALKIMLEELALTWVIEDEVMKITTIAIAEERMQTRVYPVGDLVISPSVQLGNVGGGLGGGGQQGGGGFGGGQQGGGGFGGGGGGFGGGGGGFGSVSDDAATELSGLKKKPALTN